MTDNNTKELEQIQQIQQIQEPVLDVPRGYQDRTSYAKFYLAIEETPDGEWRPINFEDRRTANNFRNTVKVYFASKNKFVKIKQRGTIVYARLIK